MELYNFLVPHFNHKLGEEAMGWREVFWLRCIELLYGSCCICVCGVTIFLINKRIVCVQPLFAQDMGILSITEQPFDRIIKIFHNKFLQPPPSSPVPLNSPVWDLGSPWRSFQTSWQGCHLYIFSGHCTYFLDIVPN